MRIMTKPQALYFKKKKRRFEQRIQFTPKKPMDNLVLYWGVEVVLYVSGGEGNIYNKFKYIFRGGISII